MDLDPFAVIPAAVVVESTVGVLALLVPRRGWAPLAALLAAFIAILVLHVRAGGEHCGCLGGALALPAWLMLLIDGSLLVAIVALAIARHRHAGAPPADGSSTAQRARAGGARVGTALPSGLALGLALGWFASARLLPLRPAESRVAIGSGSDGAARPASGQAAMNATAEASAPIATASSAASAPPTLPTTPPPSAAPAAWRLPEVIPDQVILRPLQWKGKRLAETELGRWTDTSTFPADATVVIYYESCSHCAAHLRELAEKQAAAKPGTDSSPGAGGAASSANASGAAPRYVLVQLPTPAAYTGKLFVDRLPEGMHVQLPAQVQAWVITPPWDVTIHDGVVTDAERVKWPGET
jgi:hypothetical protein